MRAKSLNRASVIEFRDEHSFAHVGAPHENKYSTLFMVMSTQTAWVEFNFYDGCCLKFALGAFNIKGRVSGIREEIVISLQE